MLLRGGQESDGMQGESEGFAGLLRRSPCIVHAARVAVRVRVTDEAKYRQRQNHAAIDAKREAHEDMRASGANRGRPVPGGPSTGDRWTHGTSLWGEPSNTSS